MYKISDIELNMPPYIHVHVVDPQIFWLQPSCCKKYSLQLQWLKIYHRVCIYSLWIQTKLVNWRITKSIKKKKKNLKCVCLYYSHGSCSVLESSKRGIIIGAAASGSVLLTIIAGIIFCTWRQKFLPQGKFDAKRHHPMAKSECTKCYIVPGIPLIFLRF